MRRRFNRLSKTELRLLSGIGVLAVIFLAQALIGSLLDRGADKRAQQLGESSLARIELANRIARNVEKERIVLVDHILAPKGAAESIEAELGELAADLERAMGAYEPLVTQPHEAALWKDAEQSLRTFQKDVESILALSRQDRDAEARSRMNDAIIGYNDRKLVELSELNRTGVADAIVRSRSVQQTANTAHWVTRVAGLLGLLAFAGWGASRIVRYEKQITGFARELEMRNRDLDAFAGSVAHDLKNALGPIVMSPELLRHARNDPAKVLSIADRTERFSRRATAVVDSLLVFARAAGCADDEEAADLRDVVRDIEEELAPVAMAIDVSFEASDIPDLRPACAPGLLHVVLANLCDNALKYTAGRAERRVRVSARDEDGVCRIDVTDTGPGIPAADLGRIFEPFYRVEGTRAPGTGIGLATVRRIIDARSGRIAVESAMGSGSCFTVWLPLARDTSAGGHPAPPRRRERSRGQSPG